MLDLAAFFTGEVVDDQGSFQFDVTGDAAMRDAFEKLREKHEKCILCNFLACVLLYFNGDEISPARAAGDTSGSQPRQRLRERIAALPRARGNAARSRLHRAYFDKTKQNRP